MTYSPQNICALTGSSVLLNCRFSLPSPYRFFIGYWFRADDKKQDQNLLNELDSRIEYDYNNPLCSMRISDLIPSDSGVYDYRILAKYQASGSYFNDDISTTLTGKNGVTLTVTGK